jgi:hypothetical protein
LTLKKKNDIINISNEREVFKMTNETITLRMNILGGMNTYILDNVNDEETIADDWFAYGVPDQATEDDLRTIAEDEGLWLEAVASFNRCIKDTPYI